MQKRYSLALAAASLTLLGFAAPAAVAAPGSVLPLPEVQSDVQTIQAYHRSCGWVNNGWRYRSGSQYIDCRPRRPFGRDWVWRNEGPRFGWYHSRRNAWHFNGW